MHEAFNILVFERGAVSPTGDKLKTVVAQERELERQQCPVDECPVEAVVEPVTANSELLGDAEDEVVIRCSNRFCSNFDAVCARVGMTVGLRMGVLERGTPSINDTELPPVLTCF